MKSVFALQDAAERANDGNLETVQDPSNSKPHHDHEVEACPRKSVQSRGHCRLDGPISIRASDGHVLILQEGCARSKHTFWWIVGSRGIGSGARLTNAGERIDSHLLKSRDWL